VVWLADALCDKDSLVESEVVVVDAAVLVVCEEDSDAEVELLVDASAADSLVVVEAEADTDAAESLPDAEDVVDSLVDVDSDVDSVVDSAAESLVAAVLPGLRTALPSVARVLRLAAVASYSEGGGMWDTVYGTSSSSTMTKSHRGKHRRPPATWDLFCNAGALEQLYL
jgi:hypothetical protein